MIHLSNFKILSNSVSWITCIFLLSTLVTPNSLHGATHIVTSDEETPAPGPGTLRYEIENAASGDSIVINSTVTYIDMDAFTGISIEDKDLTIIGHSNFTIECSNALYIFRIINSTVTIENAVLKGAKNAGAIIAFFSNVEIVNCEILDNNSDNWGGGIFLNSGSLTLRDCILAGNQGASGGGILFQGYQLKIMNTKIRNNTITNATGSGGGIFLAKGSLTLTDSEIVNNMATGSGGGIYSNSDCAVKNSKINNNSAEEKGGGIYIYNGKLELKDLSQVNGNTTKIDGGGIYIGNNASLYGINSEINDNETTHYGGGGIHIRSGGGTRTLIECSVNGNVANTEGGGIYNQGNLDLENVEVNQNNARYGGGLYVYSGSTTIDHSKINENEAITDGGGIYSRTKLDIKNNTKINKNNAGQTGGGLWMSHGGQSSTISSGNVNNNRALRAAGILIGDGNLEITQNSSVTNNENTGYFDGAGIYNANAELTINQSSIKNNKTPANGGGIFIANGNNASLTTDRADISENDASEKGGGIYTNTTTTFKNSTINKNTASGPGGGIYVAELPGAHLTIENSKINENTASYGGGVILYPNNNSNSITNSEFKNNTSSNQGGGLWMKANTTISETIFKNNEANSQGGGIFMDQGTSEIAGSDLIMNRANAGGGLFIFKGNLNIESTTLSQNESSTSGGGLYHRSGMLTIKSLSQLTENTATNHGGGIYSLSELEIDNSSVNNNSASENGGGIHVTQPVTIKNNSLVNNNIAGQTGGGIWINHSGQTSFISESQVNTNKALKAGGILIRDGVLNIVQGSKINGNENTGASGGGGLFNENAILSIKNSSIGNNKTTNSGGGIFIDSGSNASFSTDNAVFSNNKAAGNGGGVFIRSNIAANIKNSTFQQNSANNGGGIFSRSTLEVDHSTILENTASRNGGGLYSTHSVTLKNNSQFKSNEAAQFGGGIYLSNGTHLVQNATIIENKSNNSGGGIFFNEQSLIIENSKINNNSSTGNKGGGIHNEKGALIIEDSEVNNNSAFTWGGGIYSSYLSGAISFSIMGSQINGNSANNGGGISVDVINNYSINDSEFIGNSASNNGGGINIIGGNGMVNIENTIIKNNKARSGGGIHNSSMDLKIMESQINNNSASHNGGGIYNIDNKIAFSTSKINNNTSDYNGGGIWNNGTLLVSQSEVLDNQSKYWGGGIHNLKNAEFTEIIMEGNSSENGGGMANFGDLGIDYSTITNNSADNGGGLQNETYQSYSGDLSIHNSIVALNNAGNGPDINNVAAINGNHNLLTSYDNSGLTPDGTDNLAGDPLFVSNFSNVDLTECSPAIDAASNGNDMGAIQSGLTAIIPNILTASVTVTLNEINPDSVSISPSMIDYDFGSCTDISFKFFPATFNCSDVGQSNTTTVTVTYSGGQSFQETINLIVKDELAPGFTDLPENDTIYIQESETVPGNYPVQYEDQCGGMVTLDINEKTSAIACGEELARTYKITDLSGNSTSYIQTIIIGNEMGPEITILDEDMIDVSEINSSPDYRITHDTSFTTFTNDEIIREYCGETKKIRRSYTALDACQNTTVATKEITFTDQFNPGLTKVAPFLKGVQSGDTVHLVDCIYPDATQSDISWTDNSNKAIAKTNIFSNILPIHSPFGMYKLLNYNYTVEDECGNETELDFHLGLYDLTGPVFQFFPQDTTISSPDSLPEIDPNVIILDICNYVVWDTVITKPIVNPITTDTIAFSRKWIARDLVGHETFKEQMVFIKDNESQYASFTSRIAYHNDTIPDRFDGEIGENGIRFDLFRLDTSSGDTIKVDATFSQNWFGKMGKVYFTSILPGTYQVKVEIPEEYALSPDTLFNLKGWSDTLELTKDSTLDVGLLTLSPIEEFIPDNSTDINSSERIFTIASSGHKTFRWEISPNPSNGKIHLKLPDDSNYTFRLMDGNGKIIQSGEVSNRQTLHLNKVIDGLYYIHLMKDEELIGHKKLIIMQ